MLLNAKQHKQVELTYQICFRNRSQQHNEKGNLYSICSIGNDTFKKKTTTGPTKVGVHADLISPFVFIITLYTGQPHPKYFFNLLRQPHLGRKDFQSGINSNTIF
uniref:Uncharacterized protein n=1 Tax=Micrurus surinamensis TaxID=129470 RepID=A0A2D4P1V9_MICSU